MTFKRFEFSNFYKCDIWYQGILFRTPENLYQALKVPKEEIETRRHISTLSPKDAKHYAHNMIKREDFQELKLPTMEYVQRRRFENTFWREKLLNTTGDLVEYNMWHDNFWGVCQCGKCRGGENNLGKIIMEIRGEING